MVRELLWWGRMNRWVLGISASLVLGFASTACTSGTTPAGSADAASEGASNATCPGVCGGDGVTGAVCASTFHTSACLGGTCCILAADSGPPFYDDAGSCPGGCSSPDDIACSTWYRTSACATGDLCCVNAGPGTGGDAGSDAPSDAKTD